MIRPMCYYQMEMEEEDEEEEEVHLSGKDLMRIRDAVALLVQSLLRLLQTFPLKDSPQTMIHCMQVPPGCICTPGSFHTVEPAGFHRESFSLSRSSVTCFTLNPPLANQLLLLNSEFSCLFCLFFNVSEQTVIVV